MNQVKQTSDRTYRLGDLVRETDALEEIIAGPSAFTYLHQSRVTIAVAFVLLFGLCSAVILLLPKRYQARMKILVRNERANLVVTPQQSDAPHLTDLNESLINSEVEILTSRDLLTRVVDQCQLAAAEPRRNGPDPQKALRLLETQLKVTPVKKSNIIDVVYLSSSPASAKKVLDSLSDTYLSTHLALNRSPGALKFFQDQTGLLKAQLATVQNKLTTFRDQHGGALFDEQQKALLDRLQEAEANFRQVQASLSENQERVQRLKQELPGLSPRVITQKRESSNHLSTERMATILVELNNKKVQLLSRFRPDDPLVVEVDAQIENTRAALDRVTKMQSVETATDVNPIEQSMRHDLAKAQVDGGGLRARLVTLASQVVDLRKQYSALGHATTEYTDLLRIQKQTETEYMLYNTRSEEARVANSLDEQKIANVSIVEHPHADDTPEQPKVLIDLFAALLFSAVLSLAFGYMRASSRSSARRSYSTTEKLLA